MDEQPLGPEPGESMLDWVLKWIAPLEVSEYQLRYLSISERCRANYVPPTTEMEEAYARYRRGDKAALLDLRFELRKVAYRESCEHLRRMTTQEKKALLLKLGKAYLLILDSQGFQQSGQKLESDLLAALLDVD